MTKYTKNNPLRLVTICSGYDSQAQALDELKAIYPEFDYVLANWCENDPYAIQAHNAVYPEHADKNLGDLTKVDWSRVQDFDLLTYSTPCTSISAAGRQEGIEEGSGTASSLLWYVRYAIIQKKPKYLLMENVKALTQKKFMPYFIKWQQELESYGYKNFWKVLNATDYGVPQNRERVFMVSILDENASFYFPKPTPLDRTLGDFLDKGTIDEKYYLNDERVQEFLDNITNKDDLV